MDKRESSTKGSEREILAYAITHAPRGVKGGPYESEGAQTVALLKDAWRIGPCFREYARAARGIVQHRVPTARVIRIVRKARPSEASAVEVLRELVAEHDDVKAVWWRTDILAGIASRARAVLAASGPDPMPVVRAAMVEECARVRMDRAEHGIGDFAALETAWLKCVEATRVAVGAYRKAGGK